ncbi:MAG: type II toxin-antitoxin system RelE/ParE family toxin [Alphaproteobacteria bacterium]|nr:type II toxin-antitoxin system RelE/ParE family toxin [Alphaproteobacteria bacterium]
MQVIWSPAALREIEHIYRYIAQFNPRAAEHMVMEILAAGDSLESFPYRGRVVPGTQLRETTLPYPYIIRYRIAGDHVRILRVRHGARRPTLP